MRFARILILVLVNLVLLSSIVSAIEVRITPDEPTTNDALLCSVVGADFSEELAFEYNWYINGRASSVVSRVLDSIETNVEDSVLCIVTDFLGSYIGSDSVTILAEEVEVEPVNNPPNVDIIRPADGSVFHTGERIIFEALGTDPDGDRVRHIWTFDDDGSYRLGRIAYYTYTEPGTYNIIVTATDGVATSTDSISIEVLLPPNQDPVAIIETSDNTVGPGVTVWFNARNSFDTDGEIVSYEWDFGDGETASGDPALSHVYEDSGLYFVTLTVMDNDKGFDSDSTVIIVSTIFAEENQPPVAIAGPDVTVNVGDAVIFDGSDSFDTDGEIVSYEWDFGDGETASGLEVTHSYDVAGTYIATLAVEDNDGARSYDSLIVNVNEIIPPEENQDPVAIIETSDDDVVVNELVIFDGSDSFDTDGEIVSYEWDFGDGETASGLEVTHSYDVAGFYTVTLTVRDDDSASDTDTVTISVEEGIPEINQPPVAVISVNSIVAYLGFDLEFNARNSFDTDGEIVSYEWDFGDGETASGLEVTHSYDVAGFYTVTLTVRDDDSASDTETLGISAEQINMGLDIEKRRNLRFLAKTYEIGRVEPLVYKEYYNRGEIVNLLVKITNGAGPSEVLNLRMGIPDFNYVYHINNINLDSSQTKWMIINLNIPANASPGLYIARLNLRPNNGLDAAKSAYWQFTVI